MCSIRKQSLEEAKRASNRSSPESLALPRFCGKTVMQLMVIFMPGWQQHCFLFDSRSSWQNSCITHVGITLCWWLTYSKVTQWSGLGLCLARPVGRLLQASESGWAPAAVVRFWLQFHTSWQWVCVKSTADSGCETHREKGLGVPGSTR